jgi:parallel beta-helix repeat protein
MKNSQQNIGWHLPVVGRYHLGFVLGALLLLCAVLSLSVSSSASALTTVPTKMNFQGRLTDSAGNVKANGTYNMKLRLYTVNSGGSAVWTEDRLVSAGNGVTVTNGLFSIQLGSVTTLPATLFASGALYLEVELPTPATATTSGVPTWTEGAMTPRNQMATSAYAYSAETLDGKDSTDFGQLVASNTWSGGYNIFNGEVQINAGLLPVSVSADEIFFEAGSNGFTVNTQGLFSVQNSTGSQTLLSVNTANTTITLGATTTLAANQSIRVIGGATGTRPVSPSEGMIYFDTSTKQLLTYSNGKWQADRTTGTKIVAASNSSQAAKDSADYVADGNGGGAGDGDQVQINAALTAAAGGQVYLLEGTYTVDASIQMPNNTTLRGSGPNSVIEAAFGAVGDNVIENIDTTTGAAMTVSDMTLNGRKDLSTGNIYLLNMTGVGGVQRQGVTVERVIFKNSQLGGLYLMNSKYARISGNSFFDIINVTLTVIGDKNIVKGNIIDGGTSIHLAGNANVMADNTVTGSGGLIMEGTNGTVTGNTSTGNATGLTLFDANGMTISGNIFSDNSGAGISSMDDTSMTGVTITGNTIERNADKGMYIFYATKSVISNNIMRDNGGSLRNDAIFFDSGNVDVSVTGNVISDASATTTNYGIYLPPGSSIYLADNLLLGGAVINDSTNAGVYMGQLGINQTLKTSVNAITMDAADTFTISAGSDMTISANTLTVAVPRADFNEALWINGSGVNQQVFHVDGVTGGLFDINKSTSRVQVGGTTADGTGIVLVLDDKNTTGDPTGVKGAMYYNSLYKRFRCYGETKWVDCRVNAASNTAVSSVTNTTTETQFTGAYAADANECVPGRMYRITARGTYSQAALATNLTLKVKWGAAILATTGAQAMGAVAMTNQPWSLSAEAVCQTAGVSGTVEAAGDFTKHTAATASVRWAMSNTGPVTVNTTTAANIAVTAQWSVANLSNSITLRTLTINAMDNGN